MWWLCMYLSVIIFRYPKNQLKGGRSSKAPRSYWSFPPPTSTLKTEVSKGMKTCRGWAINVEGISLLSCLTLKHKPSTFLLPSPFHPLIPVFFFLRSKERHVPNPWACGSIWCNRVFARQSCSDGRETHVEDAKGLQGGTRSCGRCFCWYQKRVRVGIEQKEWSRFTKRCVYFFEHGTHFFGEDLLYWGRFFLKDSSDSTFPQD